MKRQDLNHNIVRKVKPIENTEKQEKGGPKGLEPTRYGDWERGGRVSDF